MLLDLDEAVLSCRTDRARSYIAEAVLSYKSGAYRSAIVSTWIAVVFDFIDKMYELEAFGDKRVNDTISSIRSIERKINSRSIKIAQNLEGSLIDDAHKKFDLITEIQMQDLLRLRDDRNRCAHPSLQEEGLPYMPSAELARYHISNAIESLLSQHPVQGKAALDSLTRTVQSPLFPTGFDEAVRVLRAGPLERANESLVRNFTVVMIKNILHEEKSESRDRFGAALLATISLYREISENTLKNDFSRLLRITSDENLDRAIPLLRQISHLWTWLDDDCRIRIERYVQNPPDEQCYQVIRHSLGVPDLEQYAVDNLIRLEASKLAKLINDHDGNRKLVDFMTDYYCRSANWNEANSNASTLIIPHAASFDKVNVSKILSAVVNESEIKGSHKRFAVIEAILESDPENERVSIERWKEFYDDVVVHGYSTDHKDYFEILTPIFPEIGIQPPIDE